MESFFLTIGTIVVTAIIIVILKASGSGIAELLTLLVCSMVMLIAFRYMEPVINFMDSLDKQNAVEIPFFKTILKAVGISITAEIAQMICEDTGNRASGKVVQYLSVAVMMHLMLPMLSSLLDLLEGVLKRI